MSERRRRGSDAGRLQAWVLVLALAFVAVALQQSHRYQRLRAADPAATPLDARTAYRNSVHAFELYCESSTPAETGCEDARRFLRAVARRECDAAAAALERMSRAAPELPARTHPLAPPFRALHEQACPREAPPGGAGPASPLPTRGGGLPPS